MKFNKKFTILLLLAFTVTTSALFAQQAKTERPEKEQKTERKAWKKLDKTEKKAVKKNEKLHQKEDKEVRKAGEKKTQNKADQQRSKAKKAPLPGNRYGTKKGKLKGSEFGQERSMEAHEKGKINKQKKRPKQAKIKTTPTEVQ